MQTNWLRWTLMLILAAASGVHGAQPLEEPAKVGSAPDSPAGSVPVAEVTQLLLPGKDGVAGDFRPNCLQVIGDYLYASNEGNGGAIHYLKRDSKAGRLTYSGTVPSPNKNLPAEIYAAGGRLYAYAHTCGDNKIVRYDIDAQSGMPVEKGSTDVTRNDGAGHPINATWSGMAVASLDQKNLYVTADNVILWYKLDADGGLVKSGELAGKGIGWLLAIAPDGRHLYGFNDDPVPAIACIECKPSGELAAKSVTLLDPKWKVTHSQGLELEPSISFTPDGKGLYLGYWNSLVAPSYLAIFRRDPESGQLTMQASGCGNDPDFKLANLRGLKLVFLPDGLSGFACSRSGTLLRSFRRDAATGRLDSITDFPEWDRRKLETAPVVFDAKNNLLIGACNNNDYTRPYALWAARTAAAPFKPYASIKATVTGGEAVAGPAAAADWPCFRGPTHDLKSPLKGIRKDWTGGLKKIWEVEGLSPGTGTYSVPVIAGDKLVISGRKGHVDEFFCFDADKGGLPLWVAEIEGKLGGHSTWGGGPHSTPAIDGDKVYVANLQGVGACLSMADGRVLWRKIVGGQYEQYTCSPLVVGDLAIFGGGTPEHKKQLYAYKKDTGEQVWTAGEEANSCSSPVLLKLAGRDQIVHGDIRRFFGVDPLTGKQIWEYSNKQMAGARENAPMATLAIEGDIVYPCFGPCPTLQIENGAAREVWSGFKRGKEQYGGGMSDPVILDGYIYQLTADGLMDQANTGWLVCADARTGEVKWAEKTFAGSMLLVDGCLLCLNYQGDLVLVEPHPEGFKKLAEVKGIIAREAWPDGKIKKLNDPGETRPAEKLCYGFAPCWAAPAVARGKVYLRYSDRLACYDLMK